MTSKDEILDDLSRVIEEVPYRLNLFMYDFLGEFPPQDVIDEFGTWESAIEEAKEARIRKKEEIVSNIRKVTRKLQSRPTKEEYQNHGEFDIDEIITVFDGWEDAVEAAGNPVYVEQVVVEEEALKDIRTAKESVAGGLSAEEYQDVGRIPIAAISKLFGSFQKACKEAGNLKSPLEEKKEYICPFCGDVFLTAVRVSLHSESDHGTRIEEDWYEKDYRCPICGSTLGEKEIRFHFSTRHQKKVPESLLSQAEETSGSPSDKRQRQKSKSEYETRSSEKTIGENLAEVDQMLSISRAIQSLGDENDLERGDRVKIELNSDKRGLRKKRRFDGKKGEILAVSYSDNGDRKFKIDLDEGGVLDILFEREELIIEGKDTLK